MQPFFFTKGIKFSSTGSLLGRGDLVFFDFFSPSYDLATGVYTFDSDESFIINTFYYGGFILNYSLTDNMCEAFDFIKGGTITVTRESNVYEIKVDCIALSGGSITGYYKGPLNFIDRSN